MSFRHSSLIFCLAAVLALGMAGDGFARAGFGGSFGSRGSSTFSTPPSTSVSPFGGSAINRSMTSPNASVFRPNAYGNTGGFFGGGFGRGLLGGFLGAGLFGLLFGHGLFGGMGGGGSILGLLIQIGLLFLVVKLVMGFFRNRAQPGFAGSAFSPTAGLGGLAGGSPFSGFGGGSAAQREKLQIQPADFNIFEQRLNEVEAAFGQENYDALRHVVTPEMASFFSEQLAENASKGLVNKLGTPKLLQGDLAEAWREGTSEYATVAMRFSLTDWTIERNSGRVVSGDPANPQDVTEVWTFTRPAGASPADWKLSAIQQA